jgi:hypothetical protein
MLALNDEATTANYTVVAPPNQCSNVTISIPPIRPQSSPPVVALVVVPILPPERDPFHGAGPRTAAYPFPIPLPAPVPPDAGVRAFEYANQRLNALPTATRQR